MMLESSVISPLLAYLAGYGPTARQRKPVAVLQAYFDDTVRGRNGERMLFLAGYVNFAEKWISFSNEWKSVLADSPRISHLHMAEAAARRGEFERISPPERDAKIWRLSEVIKRSAPWSFHASIDWAEHVKLFGQSPPHGYRTPYLNCYIGIVVGLAKHHRDLGLSMPTDLVFDESDVVSRPAILLYDTLKESLPEDIRKMMGGTPAFKSDKDILPLQAADMLAWHIQRQTSGIDLNVTMPISDNIFPRGQHVGLHIGGADLKMIADFVVAQNNPPGRKEWKAMLDHLTDR